MKYLLSFFLLLAAFNTKAQELNCLVNVNGVQSGGSDREVYENLRQAVQEFMNTRRWTNESFAPEERINCILTIQINKRISTTGFEATAQIQSSRPVFKSGYTTVVLNMADENFKFDYVEFQPLDFNESNFTSNLTSLLAYYAYLIIGLDYDTFSPLGGTTYFQKANNVIQNAQNSIFPGWTPMGSLRNKYWMIHNLQDKAYQPIRQSFYQYHRLGLDQMHADPVKAREAILESLKLIQGAHKAKPGSMIQQLYMKGKSEELVGIWSGAFPNEKALVVPILSEIDPNSAIEYAKINTN